jgi:hypothetical protein
VIGFPRTLQDEPTRTIPNNDTADPNFAEPAIENELPICEANAAEREPATLTLPRVRRDDPSLVSPAKKSVEPPATDAPTERLDAPVTLWETEKDRPTTPFPDAETDLIAALP